MIFNAPSISMFIGIIMLSGCASFAPGSDEMQIEERDGVSVLLIPAEYREVYFSPASSLERHCRAPGPDFTVQASEGISLNMSDPALGDAKGGVGYDSGQAALGLGGRSVDVLITRELLYRACELSSNVKADKKMTISIYKLFLQTIERIAKVQTKNGIASTSDKISVVLPTSSNSALSSSSNSGSSNSSNSSKDTNTSVSGNDLENNSSGFPSNP